ncbi:MAG TPA: hypothetical protein VHB54_05250 [Mucilaginibacter sp.]|nr:hypothetical protein [Mucilaginibacter sp.]
MTAFVDNLTSEVNNFIQSAYNKHIDWESKPAPGKWSNKEIVGHLRDRAVKSGHPADQKTQYGLWEWRTR